MNPERRLAELGIELPPASKPMGTYVPWVQTGNLLFLSGLGPRRPDGTFVAGKLGAGVSIEQGREAARIVGLNMLASIRAALGSLDRVERVVKTLGMVNSAPDFDQHPKVIDGFADLFGELGRGLGDRPAPALVVGQRHAEGASRGAVRLRDAQRLAEHPAAHRGDVGTGIVDGRHRGLERTPRRLEHLGVSGEVAVDHEARDAPRARARLGERGAPDRAAGHQGRHPALDQLGRGLARELGGDVAGVDQREREAEVGTGQRLCDPRLRTERQAQAAVRRGHLDATQAERRGGLDRLAADAALALPEGRAGRDHVAGEGGDRRIEEGLEFNVLGLAVGIDPNDFALRLPGFGRVGPGIGTAEAAAPR